MNDTLDPREQIDKMDAELDAVRKKAERLAEENAEKRKELLAKIRDEDLEAVKEIIKRHGFTMTDLRSVIKTRSSGKKTAARKRTVKRKA